MIAVLVNVVVISAEIQDISIPFGSSNTSTSDERRVSQFNRLVSNRLTTNDQFMAVAIAVKVTLTKRRKD